MPCAARVRAGLRDGSFGRIERTDTVPVEFIGIARTADRSETIAETGPAVEPEYLSQLARTHEQSGFDRVLVAHSSSSPDGFIVADQVLNATTRLGVLLAHRPGFVAPTIAARKFATIDAFHPGRIALHVITGGDDGDQARDGDFSDKVTRYRRTDEFLDIVKLEWSSEQHFDYDGDFYRVGDAWSWLRPAAICRSTPAARRRTRSGSAAGTPTSTPSGANRLTASASASLRSAPPLGPPAGASTSSRSAFARLPPKPRRWPGSERIRS